MTTRQINVTLGTAGHIDHGKTALVRLLTGCETDRLKEEKERGMSIELGFAPCTLGELEVGIVDVPGHEHFIKTMVAGATGIDGVLLVIAADDGVMPQTREHLDILTLLGVRHGLVALTKIDRAAPERQDEVREQIRALVRGTFLEGAPVLGVSSVTGDGFFPLQEAIRALVASITPRGSSGVFRMPLERGFSMKGHGTVVSGVPVSGAAHIDDEIELLPHGATGRIHSIQVYGRDSETAQTGQCAAINVRKWDWSEIHRGSVVATPGYFVPQMWYLCELRVLEHEGLFVKNAADVKFHTGTSEVSATVYLLADAAGVAQPPPAGVASSLSSQAGAPVPHKHQQPDVARAGETWLVQVRADAPVVAGPNDAFLLRAASPPRTIGGGRIVEALAGKIKRTRPEAVEEAKRLAEAVRTERTFAEFCAESAPRLAANEREVSLRAKLPVARARELLAELAAEGKIFECARGEWMHRATLAALESRVLDALAEFHRASPESAGLAPNDLAEKLRAEKSVLAAAVRSLVAAGKLAERGARLALASHTSVFSDADRPLATALEKLFRERPFSPPGLDEAVAATHCEARKLERVLKLLVESGALVRVAPDLYFHRDAIARAREILIDHIRREGSLESVKFKYLLDTSRKFAIPLLDWFDASGLTVNRNHTRFLRETK